VLTVDYEEVRGRRGVGAEMMMAVRGKEYLW
jgi:hypothetical protein